MLRSRSLVSTLLLAFAAFGVHAQTNEDSSYTPNYVTLSSPSWPSAASWNALNSSVGGKLSALRPWTAVCYASDPLFDESSCQTVLSNYSSDTTREAHAAALLWDNWETCGYGDGCGLDVLDPKIVYNRTCEQGSIPPYSVQVSNAQEISAVVNWAVQNKVKTTVKNTGHDFLGRSTAPSTLQVWTHSMDSITYDAAFVPQGSSSSPVPAVTIAAGAQVENIYAFLEANNISAVLGGCLTVGAAGGFVQGGGHGPMSPAYGLAADNVLQVEIVTADGTIRTINVVQNSDLFWALRGGGAGTYGIVTSVTLAAHPPTTVSTSLLTVTPDPSLNASELAIGWINLTAQYANEWNENGLAMTSVVSSTRYYLNLYWPSDSAPLSMLYPFFEAVLSNSTYTIDSNTTADAAFSSFTAAVIQSIDPLFDAFNIYGTNSHMASRLVPYTYLSSSSSSGQVAQAIWEGHQVLNGPLTGGAAGTPGEVPVVILGDMPAATRGQSDATGANPGLYEATWHTVYASVWFSAATEATMEAVVDATHAATGPLTKLGITTSYQNEGDAYETDWQNAFFGSKYEKLLSIKQRYDPSNFFNTWQGVGSVDSLDAWQCFHAAAPES
ncbi:Uncharacterized FAD-linked [Sparassis crispa]|uniref:Uncharacterized FAD-linked n=1 Tax=Sparassis crispa TaxID=139825 RepID=A0A401GHC5_9APHY|nr:Uncharacterized FAD-linked [Sparassis crispa]GBE81597.1 Uncharacterized FAD-linked [Sparassis crispa]